ncbi:hypothetical protein [Phytomonospora endophytica]|uniref:Uncharacterized protein n=1 Tax=Phytomonospora endophytica TaxID=714109 RepID=A0A841FFB7_9ACTN|nr:hypothetical protein [Phytomonospora endophytica]MBB6036011.1 hypothetical protein [Phytomonospora endophytica]
MRPPHSCPSATKNWSSPDSGRPSPASGRAAQSSVSYGDSSP